jgi:Flp pilus assembly secretin CpaC
VAFGSQACTALDIVNTRSTSGATPAADAAVAIRARRTSTTDWVTIRAGGSYMLTGLTNANQVEIQREDQSNTQLPVTGVALA